MNKKLSLFLIAVAVVAIVVYLGRTTQSNQSIGQRQSTTKQSKIDTENVFPIFSLSDVDGNILTPDSFREKPSIIWFTTSWCVPCQIGAKKVAKLDDELGGKAFDVLVVFVDPRENEDDLRKWKQKFANEDWIVAFDNPVNPLSKKINLKYLDTKYLLDKNNIIQDIDSQIADERYLEIIKKIVGNL